MAEYFTQTRIEHFLSGREGIIREARRFNSQETENRSPGLSLTIAYDEDVKIMTWNLYGHAFYGEFLDRAGVDDISELEGKLVQVAVNKSDGEETAVGIAIKEN